MIDDETETRSFLSSFLQQLDGGMGFRILSTIVFIVQDCKYIYCQNK